MPWLTALAMSFTLGVLAWLACRGMAGLRACQAARLEPPTVAAWPRISLLVPVAGAAPGLAANLESLLAQDYPAFEAVLVTAGMDDPAVPVIRELMGRHPRVRHVVSGPARGCGQKNHNLLAGLKAADPAGQVLVFCDCGHLAHPAFLQDLVAPIVKGAAVSSGYHAVRPGGHRIVTWGRAATVLALRLTREIPALMQPWGGATACRRDAFQRLGVAGLWSWTVVDDVSLAARLQDQQLPVARAGSAELATTLQDETLAGWSAWLTRQWLYLKFYLPGSWLATGLFLYLTAGLTLSSAGRLLLAPAAGGEPMALLLALLYLGGLSALALNLRSRFQDPPPAWRWLAACAAALGMGVWVHAKTCLTQTLRWHGLTYRVGPGGQVREVQGPEKGKAPRA